MQKGFTLLELLIIIALFVGVGTLAYFFSNPHNRYITVRNETRRQDVLNIMAAIQASAGDNGGKLPEHLATGEAMLGTGSSCAMTNSKCNTKAKCINLMTGEGNVGKYLNVMPIDPAGEPNFTAEMTGYAVARSPEGDIVVKACGAEGKAGIYATK